MLFHDIFSGLFIVNFYYAMLCIVQMHSMCICILLCLYSLVSIYTIWIIKVFLCPVQFCSVRCDCLRSWIVLLEFSRPNRQEYHLIPSQHQCYTPFPTLPWDSYLFPASARPASGTTAFTSLQIVPGICSFVRSYHFIEGDDSGIGFWYFTRRFESMV